MGTSGIGWIYSGWFARHQLVLGFRGANAAPIVDGTESHDKAILVGVRKRGRIFQALVAAGPAKLGSSRTTGDQLVTTTTYPNEFGGAFSAELGFISPSFGIGFDIFASRSSNISFTGLTLSLQVGWFGNPP